MNTDQLPMTDEEEQAWQDIEHKRVGEYLQRAQLKAARFVQDYHNELALMTLRKAFELGYRAGFTDGQEKKQWKQN